jgi:Protein of unknown function (DUF2975)
MPGKQHLFAVTHWLLKAAALFVTFIVAVLGLALGGILVAVTNLDPNHLGIPATLEGIARTDALVIAAFVIFCGLICIGLASFALRATREIIETAISGDPFVSANAGRLARIGWLLLAAEVVGLLANPIFDHLVSQLVPEAIRAKANMHFEDIGFGMSPIGLLAVLLIFVLAQIFRHGSAMRAELEATV